MRVLGVVTQWLLFCSRISHNLNYTNKDFARVFLADAATAASGGNKISFGGVKTVLDDPEVYSAVQKKDVHVNYTQGPQEKEKSIFGKFWFVLVIETRIVYV